MSLDFKFLNTLQMNTEYFNIYFKISLYLSNRLTINHQDIIGMELYKWYLSLYICGTAS
jgi:hypothetical protein